MPKPSNVWAEAWAAATRGKALSINADHWPGVVASGPSSRLVVSRSGNAYRLQTRRSERDKWSPVICDAVEPQQFAELLGRTDPALAAELAALPRDPRAVLPPMIAALGGAVRHRQRRAEWAAPDYPGVLSQDANFRVVRDLTGTVYGVQWTSAASYEAGDPPRWVTQATGPRWPELVPLMAHKSYVRGTGRKQREDLTERMAAMFKGLPERAADGPWPVVKVLPRPSRRAVTKK
jgi:hypothetical protein